MLRNPIFTAIFWEKAYDQRWTAYAWNGDDNGYLNKGQNQNDYTIKKNDFKVSHSIIIAGLGHDIRWDLTVR